MSTAESPVRLRRRRKKEVPNSSRVSISDLETITSIYQHVSDPENKDNRFPDHRDKPCSPDEILAVYSGIQLHTLMSLSLAMMRYPDTVWDKRFLRNIYPTSMEYPREGEKESQRERIATWFNVLQSRISDPFERIYEAWREYRNTVIYDNGNNKIAKQLWTDKSIETKGVQIIENWKIAQERSRPILDPRRFHAFSEVMAIFNLNFGAGVHGLQVPMRFDVVAANVVNPKQKSRFARHQVVYDFKSGGYRKEDPVFKMQVLLMSLGLKYLHRELRLNDPEVYPTTKSVVISPETDVESDIGELPGFYIITPETDPNSGFCSERIAILPDETNFLLMEIVHLAQFMFMNKESIRQWMKEEKSREGILMPKSVFFD